MFLIVVGAGRTGRRVLEMANRDGHEVVVIEEDRDRAQAAGGDFDCIAIHADGASHDTLVEADIENADALVATTDEDATNLLVMMHGRDVEVPSLVSSVNDDANTGLYRQLGVNTVESPHRLNGEYLYRTVQRPAIQDFMGMGEHAEIFEISIENGAPLDGLTLQQAGDSGLFDDDTIVVALERDGEVHIPRGKTRLEAGDLVTVFSTSGATVDNTAPFRSGG
jgi:trk system potassium uptake protein TrkA